VSRTNFLHSLHHKFVAATASLLLASCASNADSTTQTKLTHDRFAVADDSVSMQQTTIDELSGLVGSHRNPGLFWAHNDSGDKARVFLIDPASGTIKTEAKLDGIRNVDFEDITLRTHNGQPHIVVADIGDNKAVRDRLTLYQFPEPVFDGREHITVENTHITPMFIRYAEGPRDAEIIMTTPDNDLVVISKRELSNHVYQFQFEANTEKELHSRARIPIHNLTAGDINQQGEIVLRDYAQIYYWPATQKSTIEKLAEKPLLIPTAPEPQGEALAWTVDNGLYSIPEKPFLFDQVIYYYKSLIRE